MPLHWKMENSEQNKLNSIQWVWSIHREIRKKKKKYNIQYMDRVKMEWGIQGEELCAKNKIEHEFPTNSKIKTK